MSTVLLRLLSRWPSQDPPDPPPGGGGSPPPEEGGSVLDTLDETLGQYIPPSPIGNPLEMTGDAVGGYLQSELGAFLEGLWTAGLTALRESFSLADTFTRFDLAGQFTGSGGLANVWPGVWWIAIMIAIGLFFYQLIVVAARGGRGMWRAASGPVQFGVALALVLALVTSLVAGADGLTQGLLEMGLSTRDFRTILEQPGGVSTVFDENPDLGDSMEAMTRSIIMGVAGVFAIIAAFGFAAEMVIRQAIIIVLVAVIPIAAAGLVADSTASWFWRTARWIVCAVVLKPALALVLIIGVNMLDGAQGVAGLLAGSAVLLASIFCPWAVYKLLAFVDPATGAGASLRSFSSMRGSGEAGGDSGTSEMTNAARFGDTSSTGGEVGASGDSLASSVGSGAGSGALAGKPGAGAGAGAGARAGMGGGAGGSAVGGAGGAAGGGAAGAAGAATGVGAAVVAGYQLTKAAGEFAGGRLNQQGAMTGVGHPGPVPPGSGGAAPMRPAAAGSAAPGVGSAGSEAPPQGPPPEQPGPGTESGPPPPAEPPPPGPTTAGGDTSPLPPSSEPTAAEPGSGGAQPPGPEAHGHTPPAPAQHTDGPIRDTGPQEGERR